WGCSWRSSRASMRRATESFGWWWPGGFTAWGGGQSPGSRWRLAGWASATSRCSIGSSPARPGAWMRWGRWCSTWRWLGSRPSSLALARELLDLVAGWTAGRTIDAAVDSVYAARPLLEGRPANVQVLSRLRLDAALWARPGRRRPGPRGRPRKRGHRLPTPK